LIIDKLNLYLSYSTRAFAKKILKRIKEISGYFTTFRHIWCFVERSGTKYGWRLAGGEP